MMIVSILVGIRYTVYFIGTVLFSEKKCGYSYTRP